MAGATIRCQIRGGGAQHLSRDRQQPDVAPYRRVMANCAWVPASVEKIVPSALRLPPAGVQHECRGAAEFEAGTVQARAEANNAGKLGRRDASSS